LAKHCSPPDTRCTNHPQRELRSEGLGSQREKERKREREKERKREREKERKREREKERNSESQNGETKKRKTHTCEHTYKDTRICSPASTQWHTGTNTNLHTHIDMHTYTRTHPHTGSAAQ